MTTRSTRRHSQSSNRRFGTTSLLMGAGALIAYGISRRSKAGTALATAGGVLASKTARSHPSVTVQQKPRFWSTRLRKKHTSCGETSRTCLAS